MCNQSAVLAGGNQCASVNFKRGAPNFLQRRDEDIPCGLGGRRCQPAEAHGSDCAASVFCCYRVEERAQVAILDAHQQNGGHGAGSGEVLGAQVLLGQDAKPIEQLPGRLGDGHLHTAQRARVGDKRFPNRSKLEGGARIRRLKRVQSLNHHGSNHGTAPLSRTLSNGAALLELQCELSCAGPGHAKATASGAGFVAKFNMARSNRSRAGGTEVAAREQNGSDCARAARQKLVASRHVHTRRSFRSKSPNDPWSLIPQKAPQFPIYAMGVGDHPTQVVACKRVARTVWERIMYVTTSYLDIGRAHLVERRPDMHGFASSP